MARVRPAGNASTELRLVALLRAAGICGWRRGIRLKCQVTGDKWQGAKDGGGKDSPRSAQRARSAGKEARTSSSVLSVHSVVQICRPITVRPDFVFRTERVAVFADGCFWHGCPVHYTRPKSRRAFWDAKIAANKARDRRIDRALRAAGLPELRPGSPRSSRCALWYAAGWVLHVWEHALAPRQLGRTLARVRRAAGSACGLPRRVPRVVRCGTRLGR